MDSLVRFSPSSLAIFKSCRRCFWLDKHEGISRPGGVFPSLPNGMDRVIKVFHDELRAEGKLPYEIAFNSKGIPPMKLFSDQKVLDVWRNWRTGLSYRAKLFELSGALDDLAVTEDGLYVPYDFKTKGSPPSEVDCAGYYGHQLDCYALLLEKNNMPPAPFGILLYYSPGKASDCGSVKFDVTPVRLDVSSARAVELCRQAAECLSGPLPAPGYKCPYCAHHGKLVKYGSGLVA